MSLKSLHSSTRSRLLGTALVLGLSGCRGCESKPPETKIVKKGEAAEDDFSARRAKQREKRRGQGLAARRESVASIEMTIPKATEDLRSRTEAVERAMTLILEGKAGVTEARGLLTAHLTESPIDPDALYWMARSYNLERVQVPAIEWYQKSLEAAPDFVAAHRWLAYTFHAEGRCEEARPHLDAAVTARPEQADVHIDRAVCAMTLRDWDRVTADLTRACELDSFEWCEELPKLVRAEKRRKERRAKASQMGSAASKMRKGSKGGSKLDRVGLGRGKFGKMKAKAASARRAKAKASSEE